MDGGGFDRRAGARVRAGSRVRQGDEALVAIMKTRMTNPAGAQTIQSAEAGGSSTS
jgi:hypothetical protein